MQEKQQQNKRRSPDQTTITFSLDRELEALIRARCKVIRCSLSSYFRMLASQDIEGEPRIIPSTKNEPASEKSSEKVNTAFKAFEAHATDHAAKPRKQ